ncbi:MAG: hypothetical protein LBG29_01670, partial [Synergistaceae bacterium]|jgi:hypothetical protein|nr:hypothetical protein [Synergistaceae bacterium]
VEAYYGGSTLDTFSETHEDETITITRTDDNKFKWADPDGGGTTELTITGVGQADVTQSGSFYYSGDYYQYTLTYSMTKTSY